MNSLIFNNRSGSVNTTRLPTSNYIWLVFDLDNGRSYQNYVWWFATRQLAREHIKWQKKQKYSASLSSPRKFMEIPKGLRVGYII